MVGGARRHEDEEIDVRRDKEVELGVGVWVTRSRSSRSGGRRREEEELPSRRRHGLSREEGLPEPVANVGPFFLFLK